MEYVIVCPNTEEEYKRFTAQGLVDAHYFAEAYVAESGLDREYGWNGYYLMVEYAGELINIEELEGL